MPSTAIGNPPAKNRRIETMRAYFFLTKLPSYRVIRKKTCREQASPGFVWMV
jgi:hypothetical protein